MCESVWKGSDGENVRPQYFFYSGLIYHLEEGICGNFYILKRRGTSKCVFESHYLSLCYFIEENSLHLVDEELQIQF